MRRNVELVEVKQNRSTKSSENRPTEKSHVHQSIVYSMCILFTVAYIFLLFLRARFLFLYAGEFYSTVQNFWICLTAGTPLLASSSNKQTGI
jgi:ABC-type multidrug transport system permease subunit